MTTTQYGQWTRMLICYKPGVGAQLALFKSYDNQYSHRFPANKNLFFSAVLTHRNLE